MAAKKKISDELIADLLDKELPVSQIAAACGMTEKQMEQRIARLESKPDPTIAAEYEDEQRMAEEIAVDQLAFNTIRHPNARAFLLAYSFEGTVTQAARIARVSRCSHYEWLQSIEGYADAFKQAEGMFADSLEHAAMLRARDGMLKPVFQGGFEVGQVREYSDTLMLALLKAKRPDQYKERPAAVPTSEDLTQFDDAELERLAAGEAYERVLASSRRRRTGETTEGAGEAAQPPTPDLEAAARPADDGDGVAG